MSQQAKKQHRRGANVKMRLLLTALLLLLQIGLFVAITYFFAGKTIWVYAFLEIISIVMVIFIVSKKGNPSYKITWVIYILLFPAMGGLAYLFWGGGRVLPYVKRQMRRFSIGSERYVGQDPQVKNRLMYDDLHHSRQSTYLRQASGFPVFDHTETTFLAPGEKAFPVILEELEKAERYIFIEFFILAEDSMWQEILQVLRRKKSRGVEIRIIFDDFGSITRQYRGFADRLASEGFQVSIFNRIGPSLNIFMNNRNHRKILVIDGKVAFTGGMNLADEYVNRVERFGYWMDCAIMLKGRAVSAFTVMFLNMWGFCTKKRQRYPRYITDAPKEAAGFVQPYCDGPINDKNPGEGIYLQMLNTAQKYVYIVTPYLIVDNTMMRGLTLAASSGIDVRIITPHIPDKTYVHPVTQNSYGELLRAGVRIFEYTPGFVHSKLFVSDDRVATVGTVNMDYRSFYFHFECGVWMCGTDTVTDIKSHFLELQKQSQEIVLRDWKRRPLLTKFKQLLLNLFAPFM